MSPARPPGSVERLVQLLARLPGLGPRSARRVVLHLLKRREALLEPLARAIAETARDVTACTRCGNLDTADPCGICRDPAREPGLVCVVEDVADLWAIERSRAFRGRYHVLGGALSAIGGVKPEDLAVDRLIARIAEEGLSEIILATNATVEGQTTAHYVAERLKPTGIAVSRLAHGVPLGGALDYLDDGTLTAALSARRPF